MPDFFSGHSPNSHCVINKKLRTDHARLKMLIKIFIRLAHICGIINKATATMHKMIFIKPGRPKFVLSALMPVTVV